MANFPARLLNEGERIVVSTRTHWKALVIPALILLVAVALLGWSFALGSGADGAGDDDGVLVVMRWLLRIIALVLVLFTVPRVVTWWFTTYTFTSRRFIKRSGFIAKEGRTIPLNRISGVDFEIGLVDRLLGCGTLVVTDASEAGRVELADIPRVEQVQLLVAEELHRLAANDDGA